MTKGVLIFARNNHTYDYAKIACICAKMARLHLTGADEICLVSDDESYQSQKELIDESFDRIITREPPTTDTVRLYNDTPGKQIAAVFKNLDRSDAYEVSPYDETLVIDCDYFIMSNVLDGVWGSANDFMINHEYKDISNPGTSTLAYLDGNTLPMSWATVLYFKKSDYARNVFNMVQHIRENYEYYCTLYQTKSGLYRNDFVFTIALHIINGSVTGKTPTLPNKYLNNSFDTDEVYEFKSPTDVVMIAINKKTKRRRRPRDLEEKDDSTIAITRITNTDLHIMNKQSVMRHSDDILTMLEQIDD